MTAESIFSNHTTNSTVIGLVQTLDNISSHLKYLINTDTRFKSNGHERDITQASDSNIATTGNRIHYKY